MKGADRKELKHTANLYHSHDGMVGAIKSKNATTHRKVEVLSWGYDWKGRKRDLSLSYGRVECFAMYCELPLPKRWSNICNNKAIQKVSSQS